MSLDIKKGFIVGFIFASIQYLFIIGQYYDFNYILNKSEYNQLTQDGKVWAYVRKDGKL